MSDITLRNHRGELARLGTELERFGEAHHLTSDDVCMINLVLDEIVANVIRHAHDDGGEHDIAIRLALDGRKLTIEVADDGMPFNPLDAPPPNLDLPIEERPIGGLGIHIVKSLVETIGYRREHDRNHLTLTMRVSG